MVRPFESGYLAGETPNPCVDCNPMRLAALVALADALGLARVATGHYARLVWRDGEPFVARAADRAKDQSYMLWAVPPQVLARLEFPLGELTKAEVRAAAADAGLDVADEPESQEVCFAVEGYQSFLESRGVEPRSGDIVDVAGAVLGGHQGHWRFTVGQRRGLGVSAAEPLYVLERRAAGNEVVAGGRELLAVRSVHVRDVVDRRARRRRRTGSAAQVSVGAGGRGDAGASRRRAGGGPARAVLRSSSRPGRGLLPRRRRRRRRARDRRPRPTVSGTRVTTVRSGPPSTPRP